MSNPNEDEDIRTMFNTIIKNQKEQLTKESLDASIASAMVKYEERLTNIEATQTQHATDIVSIKEKLVKCEKANKNSLEFANHAEQYSRKSSIRIFNLEAAVRDDGEMEGMIDCRMLTADFLRNELAMQVSPDEIAVAHRLPKSKNPKFKNMPAPMFVRFIRLEHKIEVMRKARDINRDEDKPTTTNDLTTANKDLIKRLYDHQNFKSGWYYNGWIYGLTEDDYKIGPIGVHDDLDSLYDHRDEIGNKIEPTEKSNKKQSESPKKNSQSQPTPAHQKANSAPKGKAPSINKSDSQKQKRATRSNRGGRTAGYFLDNII